VSEKIVIIHSESIISNYHKPGENVKGINIPSSVIAVNRTLNESGYRSVTLSLTPPLSQAEAALKKLDADIVFNLFRGFDGWPESAAAITMYLENLDLCFTGCPSKPHRICENQDMVKKYLRAHSIPTPDWQVVYPGSSTKFNLNFPCLVKPVRRLASPGLTAKSVVNNYQDLKTQVEYIWQAFRQYSIIEEFQPGKEFRGLVTGNWYLKVFLLEEVIYSLPTARSGTLSNSTKQTRKYEDFTGSCEISPAAIKPALKNDIEELMKESFKVLGCRGYASIDIRLTPEGGLFVTDINPNMDILLNGWDWFHKEPPSDAYNDFIDDLLYLAKEYKEFTDWRKHKQRLDNRKSGSI